MHLRQLIFFCLCTFVRTGTEFECGMKFYRRESFSFRSMLFVYLWFKVVNEILPEYFCFESLEKFCHIYHTRNSSYNFRLPVNSSKIIKFSMNFRGPKIWNDFLSIHEKSISNLNEFKRSVKDKLLGYQNFLQFY